MKKTFTGELKLWRVMKICTLQVMIATAFCGVAAAHTTYAQLLEKKVTLSLKAVPLETALKQIEEATHVKFFYSVDQLELREEISIEVIDKSLRDVLDEMLEPHQITYKVHEKESTITLKKGREASKEGAIQPNIDTDKVQSRQLAAIITGQVTDASTQQPMAGVNVIIKGTTVGTTSGVDGKFSIAADDSDFLVFSFIGYTTFETQVNGRTVFDVVLEEDITSLKEVVVNAGYWEVKEKEQTGNISRITSKEISRQPVSNPLQAMQGRMSGVYIQQVTGIPGGPFNVQIRGRNSIAKGNDPLYIIDGVPFTSQPLTSPTTSSLILGPNGSNPLNAISPNDIESIEVLKDADATAIYGSRGSNGVVLITTKKGKTGKTTVDVNFYAGVGDVNRTVDLLGTEQYLKIRKEAFSNDDAIPQTFDAPDLTIWDTTRYTDWQKILIGNNSHTTNAQLSISGGDENTQFLVGGSFYKETTVFPGGFHYQKASSNFSIVHTSPNKKIMMTFLINYVADGNNLLNADLTSLALKLPPNAPPLYNETGGLNWENSTWENPLSELNRKYKANTNNLISNAVLSYAPLDGLQIKTSLGFNDMRMRDMSNTPSTYFNPAYGLTSANASSTFNDTSLKSWIVEPQVNYKKRIGRAQLTFLVGATFQEQVREQLVQEGRGFSSDALIENINAAASVDVFAFNNTIYRYNAIFSRINYDWDGKYILNFTGRRDGSSRFGSGNQFANFGAIGLAWIFTNEQFMNNRFAFLSFGKLRASYGTTGNDQIGDYEYLDTYSLGGSYQGVNGLRPARLSNPDFAWEINKKLEGGLELGFVQDRILVSASYYQNRSSNQLVNYPLAMTTGFTGIQKNLAATVQNTGLEFEVRTVNLKGVFQWISSLNFTAPRNKLMEFPGLEASTYANTYVIGLPLNIKKVYTSLGVNPESGLYQFEDANSDGVITSADRIRAMKTGQEYYGGFNNSLSFKGFQLDFFFQFVKQAGSNYWNLGGLNGIRSNLPEIALIDRWQNLGDDASVQRFTTGLNPSAVTSWRNYRESDAATSTSSFIRLKNVSLSYTFPTKWTKGIISRLYFQGQNILTITNFNAMDPEMVNAYGALPPLRTFTAGLQLTF